MPIVSIIVPVYKVEKYLPRCIDSILMQTFTDFECILVDDGSPDNCSVICDEYAKKDKRFKVIHKENGGLSDARNAGIKAAIGEYVYFLDSDDEITELCMEILVTLAKKYQGVNIIQGNTIKNPNDSYNKYDIIPGHFPEYTDDQLWLKKHFFIFPRILATAWNKLIKHSFIVENNLYFRKGLIHEDEQWMFFVAKKIKNMAFTTHYCYIHNIVPYSIIQSGNTIKSLQSWFLILEEMLKNMDIEILREEKKYIHFALFRQMYRIDHLLEKSELLPAYRRIIRICLKDAKRCFDFISCLGLLLLLLPYRIYHNYVFQIISGLLLCDKKKFIAFGLNRIKGKPSYNIEYRG